MSIRATATISAILVDDEQLASDELAFQLRDFPDIEIAATAANGLEAVKLIEDLEPDLVFLDVQMPGLDGMGVIRRLREKKIPLPYFVMATAYDQYAVEADGGSCAASDRGAREIGSAGTTRAETVAATNQAADQEQSPEFYRRRAGCGL